MSGSDRLLLIIHVGFAIFTLGPLIAATSATPRYIRRKDVAVLRYLNRTTRIYGLLALGILLFGLFLSKGDFARVWLTASLTLFIVALVLLLIVERDQRKAIHLMQVAIAEVTPAAPPAAKVVDVGAKADDADEKDASPQEAAAPAAGLPDEIAQVERGRITSLSGVIALLWLVILFLMIWYGE